MRSCLLVSLIAYTAGAVGSLLLRGRAARLLAAAGATAGAVAGATAGCLTLAWGPSLGSQVMILVRDAGFGFKLDALAAFFLVLLGLVGAAAAVYGFGYTAGSEKRYSLRTLGALFNLLLLALTATVLADTGLTFLLAWEVMVLAAYLAVLAEHESEETVRSALWYIGISHVGFVALVPLFLLVSGGDLTMPFEAARAHAASLPTLARGAAFLLALVGFGTKAGIVPLHVWLPMAHPVAPSHVSALMSGVVIKVAIYGLVRVLFDLVAGGPAWWGGLVLGLGAVSALLGVLYALMEHDLKRLLAYHSVENIGIILMGLGSGLLFQSYGLPGLGVLGLVAGLFHTLNHAAFKGLLFLGAGSVLHATGTRDMEALGGLARRMPWTSAFFLLGSAAISALPPLNGFASEWLLFQTLLGGLRVDDHVVALLMPVAVGMLALTGGLAAACFVKAYGITFLAMPRSEAASRAHEAPPSMLVGMGLLAVACIALGVGAPAVVPVITHVAGTLPAFAQTLPAESPVLASGVTLAGNPGGAGISPPLVALLLVVIPALAVAVLRLLGASGKPRRVPTWGCGRLGQTPRMEYTATAFAEPLRRVFAGLYRPSEDLSVDHHPESPYFVQSIAYHSAIRHRLDDLVYGPVLRGALWVSGRVRRLQAGLVHLYLVYLAAALVALTLVSLCW